MRRRNKKAKASADNHERWLITYADLITLLLIFFVILYAMSKIDMHKYEVLAQSMQLEFRKSDSIVEQGSGITGSLNPGKSKTGVTEQTDKKADNAQTKKEREDQDKKEKELQDLLKVITSYIADRKLEAQVSAKDTPRGIAITLNDLFLFDLGKADLKPAAMPVLEKLASLFPSLGNTISIEGHTDDLAVSPGSIFRDNWGLSIARSLSVLRYFTDSEKLDTRHFQATGFADTKPVAPNNSDVNRQKNRRVEIVVLREETSSPAN